MKLAEISSPETDPVQEQSIRHREAASRGVLQNNLGKVETMLSKLVNLLKDAENLTIFMFLVYVIALTHLVGFFVLNWCMQP